MSSFILLSKVTKKGKVKVCISNQDDSFPIHLVKYPGLHTKKYYTICQIEPIENDEIPYKYKETINEKIEEFKRDLKVVSLHVESEKRTETFSKSPDLYPVKNRSSCEWFRL